MGCCGWCGPQVVLLVKSENVFVEMLSAASKRLLWLLVKVAALCANPIVRLVNLRRPNRLPRISNPLLLNSATKLAHMIRTQQVRKNFCCTNFKFFLYFYEKTFRLFIFKFGNWQNWIKFAWSALYGAKTDNAVNYIGMMSSILNTGISISNF